MQRTPRNNDSMPVKGKSIIPTESEVRARAENKPEQPQKEVQPKAPKQRRSTFWAKTWVGVVTGIVLLFSVYLIYVLYKTTVTDYDKYARAAADEQWTLMTYSASRGMIYDSNLVPLASNRVVFPCSA